MVTPNVDGGVPAQLIGETWILRKRDHVLRHLIYSVFFNEQAGFSFDDNIWDAGVSSRNNRESRRSGLQDRHGSSFAIAIGGGN